MATQLVFTTQPAPLAGTSGSALDFTTDPVVEARDANGTKDTGYSGTVTLTETGSGTATYANNSVAAAAGEATFTDLAVTYTATADQETFALQAADGALTTANSSSITSDVVATQLVFAAQPGGSVSSVALAAQPVVAAQDDAGITDTDFGDEVTLRLRVGASSLSGTLTLSPAQGVIAYTDVTFHADVDGEGFTIAAGSEDFSVESEMVVSDVVATQLSFATQPADGYHGLPLLTQPIVTAQDADGITDVDFVEMVSLTIDLGGLIGGTTVSAVQGVAGFVDVEIDATEDGAFTIEADDDDNDGTDLPSVTSVPVAFVAFGPPVLNAFASPTEVKAPRLTWQPFPLARRYTVEVDDNADFSSPLLSRTSTATRVSVPERLADGVYYWRVKSISAIGEESPFSTASSFTVIPTLSQWAILFCIMAMALAAARRMGERSHP